MHTRSIQIISDLLGDSKATMGRVILEKRFLVIVSIFYILES